MSTLFQYKTSSTSTGSASPNDIIGGFGGGTHTRQDVYTFNSLVQTITDQYFGNSGSVPTNQFDYSTEKAFQVNAVNPFVHPQDNITVSGSVVQEVNDLPDDSIRRINIKSPDAMQLVTLQPGQTLEDFINGYQTQSDYDSSIQNKVKSFDLFYKQNDFVETDYNFLEDETCTLWQGLNYITPDANLNESARYVKVRDISRKEFLFASAYQIDRPLLDMVEFYNALSYTPMFDNIDRPIVGYGHVIALGDTIDNTLVTPDVMKILMDTTTNQYEMILITHEEAEEFLIKDLQLTLSQLVPFLGNKLVLPGMMRALVSLVHNVGFDNFMKTIEGRRILAAVRFNYMEYFVDNFAAFNNPYGGQSFVTNVPSQLTYTTNVTKTANVATANLAFIPMSLFGNSASLVTATPALASSYLDPTPIASSSQAVISPTPSDASTSAAINPNPINTYTAAQAAKTMENNPNGFSNTPVDPKQYQCLLPSTQENLAQQRTTEAGQASVPPDSSTQAAAPSTVQTQTNAQSGVDTAPLVTSANTLNSNPTAQANAQTVAATLASGTPAPAAAAAGAANPIWTTATIAGVMGVAQGENGIAGLRASFPGGASDTNSPGWDGTLYGGGNNTMFGNFQFNQANQQQLYNFVNSDYNTTGSNDVGNPAVQTQFAMTQVTPGNPYSDQTAINGLNQTGFWTMTDPQQASYAWNYAYERNLSVSYDSSSGTFNTSSYSTKTAGFAQQYYNLMGGSQ